MIDACLNFMLQNSVLPSTWPKTKLGGRRQCRGYAAVGEPNILSFALLKPSKIRWTDNSERAALFCHLISFQHIFYRRAHEDHR